MLTTNLHYALCVFGCPECFQLVCGFHYEISRLPSRRVRVPAGTLEQPSNPARASALELSVKKFVEKRSQFVVYPAVATKFDSLDDAYNFYNLYSWEIGFGVRYAKCRLNVHRQKCMQEIVCGCAVQRV